MTHTVSQTDPAEMTTEGLLAEIDGFKFLAVEVVERLSLIMSELHKRRQPHPFFHDRIMRFWQSISDQTLAAEAAIILANRDMIKAIIPLPRSEQIDIANGRGIPVATITPDGRIKSDDIPIRRMDPATLKRAFGPDGIRTVHEQAEMIRAAGRVERIGAITVLRDEHVIKIGNQKIAPEDLRGPLRALGYRVELERAALSSAS